MEESKQRREKNHLKSKLWAQRGSGLLSAPMNANKSFNFIFSLYKPEATTKPFLYKIWF